MKKKKRDTKLFIEVAIGDIDHLLGYGYSGEAWFMIDGSVVKITSSSIEANCVRKLFDIQEQRPKEYIDYFPKIFEYGVLAENIPFHSELRLRLHRISQWVEQQKQSGITPTNDERKMFPIFWYRRENLNSIPYSDENKFSRLVVPYTKDVLEKFSINVIDTTIENFGYRDNHNKIIMRDISCW